MEVQAAQSYVKNKSMKIPFEPLEAYAFHVSWLHKIQTLIILVTNYLFLVRGKKCAYLIWLLLIVTTFINHEGFQPQDGPDEWGFACRKTNGNCLNY